MLFRSGRHRVEAAKRLKWDNITVTILDNIDALDAEAAELMENLVRQELTPTQQSMHYARLAEIAEEKKGESPRPQIEGAPRSHKSDSVLKVAQDTSRSVSAVERDAMRVKRIKEIAACVGTTLDSGVELDALAKLSETIQTELIRRAQEGHKVSARTELKKQDRAEKEKSLGDKQKAFPTGKYSVIYADPAWG